MFIYGLSSSSEPGVIRYVGQTQNAIRLRLAVHLHRARTDEKGHKAAWIRKVLREGYKVVVSFLALASSTEDANDLERHYIRTLREEGVDLTNLADGGCSNRGWKATPEQRRVLSAAHCKVGEGTPHTEETKQLLREIRKKQHPPTLGFKYTEETRRNMSNAKLGKKNPHVGVKKTPKTKAKISASLLKIYIEEGASELKAKVAVGVNRANSEGRRRSTRGFKQSPESIANRLSSLAATMVKRKTLDPKQILEQKIERAELRLQKMKDSLQTECLITSSESDKVM